MKKFILLLLAILGLAIFGVQFARADESAGGGSGEGCCCNGTWDPNPENC